MVIASAPLLGFAQEQLKSGISLENLDRTANPGESFYQFACGGWMKNNPLPAAYSRYGSFDQLAQANNKRINTILAELASKTFTPGSTEQKLSDFYKQAMDSVRRNKDGVKPVMPLINEIEKASNTSALRDIQFKYATFGYGIPLGIGFGADEKNSRMNILNIYQGGLFLGQKEYYLDNDSATAGIRDAYKKHIIRMFQFFGFDKKSATKKMENIMKIETALAKVSKSRAELRDVAANYNKMTIEDFESNYPAIKLSAYMGKLDVDNSCFKELVVGQPDFVSGANKIVESMTADELKAYMEWDVILSAVDYLSDDVIAANFDFFGKTMSGRKENYPRWKRATSQVESQMGEALGKMYVERYFPAAAKARMEKLVENLQISLAQRIREQDWMSEETKKVALEKLDAFTVKVGYPDKWRDYSGLEIKDDSYWANIVRSNEFDLAYLIDRKLNKPVDRSEWYMTPQTVNAYYNPTTNEICFPAGILQPPFFNMEADDACNYGAIGVVIGHEMTHGFDDQGRQFDKNGNLTDWWAPGDAERFEARAKVMKDFFDNIEVLPGLHANGALTLGENLADHGGLMVAYNALQEAMKENPLQEADGFTPEQRFFLSYAYVWADNIRDEEIRSRTKSDPHALGRWRVNGALPHIDAWYEAFGIKEGDKMFVPKAERVAIW